MNENEKVFMDYIQSKGLKFTPERKAILNHVFESHGHFEAEELLIDMRKTIRGFQRQQYIEPLHCW